MTSEGSIASFVGRKVWVTGHRGMLGSAMVRSLDNEGANLLLTSRAELDLTDRVAVTTWMEENRPELIFHIGAKVGGIHANSTLPADFLYENLRQNERRNYQEPMAIGEARSSNIMTDL